MKKATFVRIMVVIGILSLIASGCTSSRLARKIAGRQAVIEKSQAKRPRWITECFQETRKSLLFSGGVEHVADYSLGVRQAKAEAIKNLVESVEVKTRTEFTESVSGSNLTKEDLGRFISDGVSFLVDNLRVRGIKPKEIYYEKLAELTSYGKVGYFYNLYALLQISREDYAEARYEAARRLLEKAIEANDKRAEEAARELLEALKEED